MGWDVHPGPGWISFVPDGTWVRRAWNPAMYRWAILDRPCGTLFASLLPLVSGRLQSAFLSTENREEPEKNGQPFVVHPLRVLLRAGAGDEEVVVEDGTKCSGWDVSRMHGHIRLASAACRRTT